MTLNILLAVLLAIAIFALYRSYLSRVREQAVTSEYREQLHQEVAHLKAQATKFRKLLHCGNGIGKRIAEIREITEALQKHAPEVFNKEPGLIYWLEATDQFLVELHVAAGSDPMQKMATASHDGAVYREVHESTGLPLPPDRLAHLEQA